MIETGDEIEREREGERESKRKKGESERERDRESDKKMRERERPSIFISFQSGINITQHDVLAAPPVLCEQFASANFLVQIVRYIAVHNFANAQLFKQTSQCWRQINYQVRFYLVMPRLSTSYLKDCRYINDSFHYVIAV